MATKKNEKVTKNKGTTAKVHNVDVSEVLIDNYMPYTMSVIVSRALPEIDGFKPSHRKLLYTMYNMRLLDKGRTKSSNIVGQTMKINPHGDGPIYGTMVRMARGNEALLLPIVDSKGNFGKIYSRDMAYAAQRYTEAKLEKVAGEFFKDIEKRVVDFVPNYDNTTEEPTLLPVTFPTILANPNTGIAVGMASSICGFNLNELCDATIEVLNSGGKEVDLIDILKAPDFPTGGKLLYNKETMQRIYDTGKGTFYIRAKYTYDKNNNCIDIHEIPYTTTVEAIIENITNLVKENTIKELTDIRDEVDKDGLKITLDLKRGVDVQLLMTKLFATTPLQSSFSCNFNILIDGVPKLMGVREILDNWIKFRTECYRRGIEYDIDKNKRKLHLMLGLEKVILDIDKAIKIIRETEKNKDVEKNLMEHFSIDEEQAKHVADLTLRNINKEYLLNRVKDIKPVEKEIAKLEGIHKSDIKIKNLIVKELEEVKNKYGKERKTDIIEEKKAELPEDILVEDYNLKIYLTSESYLKKVPLVSLRGASEHRLKEGEYIVQEIDSTNKSDLLLFSNKHKVYKMKMHELEDDKLSDWGDYLPNLLELEEGEEILYIVCTDDYTGSMIYFFEGGKTAKVDLQGYETKTNRKYLLNAYSKTSPLVRMFYLDIDEDIDVILQSDVNKILRVETSKIPEKKGTKSVGVNTMRLKKGEKVENVYRLDEIDFEDIEYYTTKNIPAVGRNLREEDKLGNK